ncbi:hypothetical protein CSAL01_12889 [Colletotrichum salicis]|uniref:Uncharacterized protein n=1 Tax=Colletotrichum salicis TaxID=1209931 RepID=A0A135V297_9PEZI|nr:hypothetical protein CSAL01_12889 [Colletotrichum salicis]
MRWELTLPWLPFASPGHVPATPVPVHHAPAARNLSRDRGGLTRPYRLSGGVMEPLALGRLVIYENVLCTVFLAVELDTAPVAAEKPFRPFRLGQLSLPARLDESLGCDPRSRVQELEVKLVHVADDEGQGGRSRPRPQCSLGTTPQRLQLNAFLEDLTAGRALGRLTARRKDELSLALAHVEVVLGAMLDDGTPFPMATCPYTLSIETHCTVVPNAMSSSLASLPGWEGFRPKQTAKKFPANGPKVS